MADIKYTTEGVDFKGEFISWAALEVERNKFRFQDSILVKVGFYYSRGDWYDHMIIDKTKWENIKSVLEGRTGWYSDFAGKHSETSIQFWEDGMLQEITDQAEIASFHAINGFSDSNLDIIYSALENLCDDGEIDLKDGMYFELDITPEDKQYQ